MTPRWLLAPTLAIALLTGCTGARARWSSVPRAAPDPNRWERAACRLEQYPPELDERALARARFEDVEARREDSSAPSAAARLLAARDAFDSRCAAWRAASAFEPTGAPAGAEHWSWL
ncbi:MAG TPA: hypothetical protein VF841_15970 [Anaeromyxobacter sp.]